MKKLVVIKFLKIFFIIISSIILIVLILFLFLKSSQKLAYFDMGTSSVEIKYEGDCGATCTYGDINVYQKRKKLFSSREIIFSLKETSPYGFDFQKLNQTQIQIHKEREKMGFCIQEPTNNICTEKTYKVDLK